MKFVKICFMKNKTRKDSGCFVQRMENEKKQKELAEAAESATDPEALAETQKTLKKKILG